MKTCCLTRELMENTIPPLLKTILSVTDIQAPGGRSVQDSTAMPGLEPTAISTTHPKLLPEGLKGSLIPISSPPLHTQETWFQVPPAHLYEVRMSTGPSPACPSHLPTVGTSAPLSNPWAGPAPGSGVTLMSPSVFKSEDNNPLSIFIFLLSTSSSAGSRSRARF